MENLSKFVVDCQFGSQKRLIIFLIGLLGLPLSGASSDIPVFRKFPGAHNERYLNHENITDICMNAIFDAALTEVDGTMYFFQGLNFWTLRPPKRKEAPKCSGPTPITSRWATVVGPIDAAFSATIKGELVTYLFKGFAVWKFSGHKNHEGVLLPEKDQEITSYFPSVPPFLDDVFVWHGDGLAYFIKNGDYWAYNLQTMELDTKDRYPNPISKWGLPVKPIDAALSHPNGHVYFFVGDEYYRNDDPELDKFEPPFPYPRKTHVGIFWCRDDEVAPGVNFQSYVETHVTNEKWSLSSSSSFLYIELLLLLICVSHNIKSSLVS